MGFINELARGFVKSAVNQVGRDGGKVISNKIYKGTHSTPFSEINISNSDNYTLESEDQILSNDLSKLNTIALLFIWIMSFVIPYLFSIISVLFGIKYLFKRKTKYYKFDKKAVFKSDKRFKNGQKFEGYKLEKVFVDNLEVDKNQRLIFLFLGIMSILIGLISYLIYKNII